MAALGALLPWVDRRFTDQYGDPVPGARLYSYAAGLVTVQPLYADANLTVPLSNPAIINSESRLVAFLGPGAYDLVLKMPSTDVTLWTLESVSDPTATVMDQLGNLWAGGSKDVTSGYTVLASDYLITVASTGGPNPAIIQLPPASQRSQPIWIKNMGNVALSIRPTGTETIDGLAAAYAVGASTSPLFKGVMLLSDGVSSYFVVANVS